MIKTTYSGQIRPKNDKIPNVAERTLHEIAHRAQQQYKNAIFVNGVDSLIYVRREFGRECTCRDIMLTPKLEADGTMGEATLDAVLSDTDVIFRESGGRSSDTDTDRHATGPEDFVWEDPNEPQTSKPDQPEEVPDPLSLENEKVLPAGSASCAACFGVGYVGGFIPHAGFREALDITANPTLVDFDVDHTETPHRMWSHTNGATATFTLVLPKGAVSAHSVKVFDNNKLLSHSTYDLECTASGSYETLNESSLISFCDGREHTIRLTSLVDQFRFSHIEIQFSFSIEATRINIPRFDAALHRTIFEGLTGSSLVLPPTVGNVNRLSVIRESLYGRAWRISNVQDWFDNKKNVHGWDCLSRMLQPYELLNMLPALPNKVRRPGQKRRTEMNRRKFL